MADSDLQLSSMIDKLKPVAWAVSVISFFINLLILPMSIYSLQVMDRVVSTGSIPTLLWLTIIMLAMFVVVGILQSVRSLIMIGAAEWFHNQASARVLPKMLAQTASEGKGAQHMRDAAVLKQFMIGNAPIAIFDAPWSILYIGGLFLIHVMLGWLVLAGAVLLVWLAWIHEVMMKNTMNRAGDVQMRGLQELEMATHNAEIIEAMGMSRALIQRWQKMQHAAEIFLKRGNQHSAMIQGLTKFLRLSLQILVTCVAAYLTVHGGLTVGAIIASSILASRALAPFEAAISSWKSCSEANSAYKRLLPLLSDDLTPDYMTLPPPLGVLSVEQASYNISGIDQPILQKLNFALEKGDLLGIIGASGSGKSTLARLVLGITPLSSGVVRLDGADITQWKKEVLGRYIGYLPQDVELFAGSVKDNIARFAPDPAAETVVEAAMLASAHELILRLPKGYDTEIGAGGLRLSAGQRQRIGLARALYGNPKLLVLDEPDASLDETGQQALIAALQEAKKRQITTLLITHRKSLLVNASHLLVLREGTMQAFGTVDKVLSSQTERSAS